MVFNRLKYKILSLVGVSVALVILVFAYYFAQRQERSILEQNEQTIHKLTESVISAMHSVMIPGFAHIAQGYAERLKQVPGVVDFRIMRTDGSEAFRDNATIAAVNRRRGEEQFVPRATEERVPVLAADHPQLKFLLQEEGNEYATYREMLPTGEVQTFLDPIPNRPSCYKCHGRDHAVRGIIKLTMSLAPVHNEILKTREQTILGAAIAITAILLLTGYMMGRSVLGPVEKVTEAMERAASGDLGQRVPVVSGDELGKMATSFNFMADELKRSYEGLKLEQDKLTTIIHSAGEGIIVTDATGSIVLVNPAAERLLGKSVGELERAGFLGLLGSEEIMKSCLERGVVSEPEPLLYQGRLLAVCAATIRAADGEPIGSAALVRDVTEQKRLEEELRRQSVTDGLTGLFNRRHLDTCLANEFGRAKRYGSPMSILMMDIDHFKRVNDQHGHDKGDRVLRVVAQTLRGALRNHDLPCRYGGEEFLAILPNTGLQGAFAVAERLRREVEALDIDGLRVTVSMGVGTIPDLVVPTAEALCEAADAALYEAKHAGRNRVRIAEGRAAPPPASES